MLASSCNGIGAKQQVTRVVLISLDTLRADGLTAEIMPRTFEWARRGLVFERHYAATSSTQPTHASLFTGLHPWRHGVVRNGAILACDHETLAERLKREGYTTYAVVASFPLHRDFGFGQGFDYYVNDFSMHDSFETWAGRSLPGGFSSDAALVGSWADSLLDAASGERQFFFFHFFDAHAPYGDSAGARDSLNDELVLQRIRDGVQQPSELIRRARRGYDRDLRVLDETLGRLLDRLVHERGFDSHVVVVSDHGESFGEAGSMGHGKRLTEEQLRVPLFVLSPSAGTGTRADPVGSVDVAKTLLGFAGIQTYLEVGPEQAAEELAGRDLLDESAPRTPRVVGMRRSFERPYPELRVDGKVHTIRGPRFYSVEGDRLLTGDEASLALGDRSDAPFDEAGSDRARALFGSFERQLSDSVASERLDPETRAALEALGYVR